MRKRYIGIDLGGTNIKGAVVNEQGEIIRQSTCPTHAEQGAEAVTATIADMIRDLAKGEDIAGVGLGCPGTVDDNCGTVVYACNLGWINYDVRSALKKMTGFSVRLVNDANAAALAEVVAGAAKGAQSAVMVTLGTGVGGGIVIEGQLLHGAHGSGAELGHMVLNRDETAVCGCGKRGCVEQYCSASGIVRMAKLALEASDEESSLRSLDKMTCKDIFDAGRAGDKLALAVLDQYYAYMGEFLANVCNVVNPEVVVLGGGVSKAGTVLLDGLRPYFHKYVFHAAANVEFALAALGNDAGAYGAFKLALDAYTK